MEDDSLLTTKDVANRYRVHPKTIDGMVKSGRIPAPLPGWTGAERRWLQSEIVSHIRGMRETEKAEQVK